MHPDNVNNQIGTHTWWQFWLAITHSSIPSHQKNLFGKDSNWKDTHTMLYLDEHNTFSVEFPKATLGGGINQPVDLKSYDHHKTKAYFIEQLTYFIPPPKAIKGVLSLQPVDLSATWA